MVQLFKEILLKTVVKTVDAADSSLDFYDFPSILADTLPKDFDLFKPFFEKLDDQRRCISFIVHPLAELCE